VNKNYFSRLAAWCHVDTIWCSEQYFTLRQEGRIKCFYSHTTSLGTTVPAYRASALSILTEFYAHHSMHRESILKKFQQDDTLVQCFISCKLLYIFRVKYSPIIRSSIKLYLQHLVLTNSVWPAVVVDESDGWIFDPKYVEQLAGNKTLYKSVILLEPFLEYRNRLPSQDRISASWN
jgi:hypothetical protein